VADLGPVGWPLFLPQAWGCGYAAEACAAALDWFTGALPGEPVVLTVGYGWHPGKLKGGCNAGSCQP
jgi:hypothetical protein